MSLPATYKRAAFHELGGPLVIEDVPLRQPNADEILIKVEACGVCHSDVFARYNGLGGGFPLVPGHEIIGRVAAVGANVPSAWKIGDRIGAGWHGGRDGTCQACTEGQYQMCDNPIVNGETRDGGYAEYVNILAQAAVRIPDHVDAAKFAAILCAGLTAFNPLRHQGIKAGDTVAVQGLGGLGHLALQYANKMGYRVIAISRGAEKEKAARELGAHEYIDASKGDVGEQLKALGGARAVLTTALSGDAFTPLIKGITPLGKLVVLSVLPEPIKVDIGALLNKAVSLLSYPAGHPKEAEDAVLFTERHGVDCLIETFPLAEANKAFGECPAKCDIGLTLTSGRCDDKRQGTLPGGVDNVGVSCEKGVDRGSLTLFSNP